MNVLPYDFSSKKVPRFRGHGLIEDISCRSELTQYLAELCQGFPSSGSNRDYCYDYLSGGGLVNMILGATRILHTRTLRHDDVNQCVFKLNKGIVSQSTLRGILWKLDQEGHGKFSPAINRFSFSQLELGKMTIDLDSTAIVHHGSQDGVAKVNNHQRFWRICHHPLIALVSEAKMVANARMRTSDNAYSMDFPEFFDELFSIISPNRIRLFRADSGFANETIMSRMEQEKLKYIIATRMMGPLDWRIFEHKEWFPIEDGYWTASVDYLGKGRKKLWRVIIVRKNSGKHPGTGGKLLFTKFGEFEQYEYTDFVTNNEFSSELISQLYNQRAGYENRIRELNYSNWIDWVCADDFYTPDAAFRWKVIAHNIKILFRLQMLNQKRNPVLSTLRFQCIAIGPFLVKTCRKAILMFNANQIRSQFLEWLFSKVSNLLPLFHTYNSQIEIIRN